MNGQNTVRNLRDREARSSAIRDLTRLYEDHAIGEQLSQAGPCPCHPDGQPAQINHHDAVVLGIRALNAEMDDPWPAGLAKP